MPAIGSIHAEQERRRVEGHNTKVENLLTAAFAVFEELRRAHLDNAILRDRVAMLTEDNDRLIAIVEGQGRLLDEADYGGRHAPVLSART